MELILQRLRGDGEAVPGDLLLSAGGHFCTLENRDHLIPAGRYQILLTVSGRAARGELWSPREDHVLPLLVGVPGRTGIRIHAGNWATDSAGCVLVGDARTPSGGLFHSRMSLTRLLLRFHQATDTIWLVVYDAPASPEVKA